MINSLTMIVAIALGGIIGITVITTAIAAGIFGASESLTDLRYGDEVVSVLGQIGSAGVGALAGYFSARIINTREEERMESSKSFDGSQKTEEYGLLETPPDEDAPHGVNEDEEMDDE
jgi:hypothetical protein